MRRPFAVPPVTDRPHSAAALSDRVKAKEELRQIFATMAETAGSSLTAPKIFTPEEKELNEILLTAFRKISESLAGGPYLDGEEIEALALKAENLIFDEGADIDIDCGVFTALSLAAVSAKVRFLEKLIEAGAKLDYCDHDNATTTLIFAATGGNVYTVYLVLKKTLEEGRGDSVNKQDQGGYTALHMAVMAANPEIVRLLLLSGADPSIASSIGEIALKIAEAGSIISSETADRRKQIAEIIKSYPSHAGVVDEVGIRKKFQELEFGKNIVIMNAAPISGRPNPEIKALMVSKAEALFSLCGEVDVNTKTITLNDPSANQISFLNIAAKLGNVDYVRRLLALGAESDSVDAFGRSVLRNAAVSGNPEVVRLIFADLKANGKKDSAFDMKDSRRSSMIIQEAIESPIFFRKDVGPEDVEKASEVIRILFSEVDDEVIRFRSAQRIAEIMWGKFRHCKQIETLLSILPPMEAHEAVVRIVTRYGLNEQTQNLISILPEKPRDGAKAVVATDPPPPKPQPKILTPEEELERTQKELFGLLQDLELRMRRIKKYCCSVEDVAVIQNAVARGADPNSATENGFTILHFLARSGNDVTVRGLIAKGARFSENCDGITPLDCAVDVSDAKMVKTLLECANPNVAQVQKVLLKAIGEKQEAVVRVIISDKKFIAGFAGMETKSKNIAIDELRRAAKNLPKLKTQISEFVEAVNDRASGASAAVATVVENVAVPAKTKKQIQQERAEERARLAAAAEAQKKYEEERRKINAARRAAELAAMAAEDHRPASESAVLESATVVAPLPQEAPAYGGGGGEGGSESMRSRLNPAASEFRPAPPPIAAASAPTTDLPDWLNAIVKKVTALEGCTSFRLKGSKLYLQYVERSRGERAAHDFDFEILIPRMADFFEKNPQAEAETRNFVKENFNVEDDAVSIFFDRATGKFLNINIKHPSGVDFVIYDHPPKLDWSIDLDALRLEYKGNHDRPVLKFTSGFEVEGDPSISYPKKKSAEYEPIINFDSYKLLQRLCFFKVTGVIDRELAAMIPKEKNCADFVFLESGGTPAMLKEKLTTFTANHGFSAEEKSSFLIEFRKLMGRDVPSKITPKFYESFTKKVDEMLLELGVVPSTVTTPIAAAAAAPAQVVVSASSR